MKTKIIQNIKSIILALILVVGVSYVYAYSPWAPPTATAPGNNTDIPLNVSGTGQSKSGKLAVGTSTLPTATMDVTGTIYATGGATLNTGNAGNGLIVQYGNVGIGTTTPGATLNVKGNFEISSPSYDNVLYGWASDANNFAIEAHNAANTVKDNIILDPWGGNVGIGTTSPTQKLDVNGYVKGTGVCIGADCRTAWPTPPALLFGGIYTMTGPGSGASCATTNPATGACTCPSGYTSQRIVVTQCGVDGNCTGGDGAKGTAYYCYKTL